MEPGIQVQVDVLAAMSAPSDDLSRQCRRASDAVTSEALPSGAFGHVTHSALISHMADDFRAELRAPLDSAASDASLVSETVVVAAHDYQAADEEGASRTRSLTMPLLPGL